MSGRVRRSRWALLLCAALFLAVQTMALVHKSSHDHETGPHACVMCVVADQLGHCMPSAGIDVSVDKCRFEPPALPAATNVSATVPPFGARGPPATEVNT